MVSVAMLSVVGLNVVALFSTQAINKNWNLRQKKLGKIEIENWQIHSQFYKTFTNTWLSKLECLQFKKHFQSSLIFVCKAGTYRKIAPNILGMSKKKTEKNTLAYF